MERKMVYLDELGLKRTAIVDEETPHKVTVHTELQLDEILAGIARDRDNHLQHSVNKTVARVPMTIVEKMMLEGSFHDEEAWRKLLNDPDYAHLRIWKGKV